MQWKHPTSPSTKKLKVEGYAISWGTLLAHFQKRGEYVNSASYCDVLLKLRDVVCRKCPGQVARVILLHYNNARPHTAQATQEKI
jgi:hypothetical protein